MTEPKAPHPDIEKHLEGMTFQERLAFAALPHDEKLRIALKARDSNREKEA